MNSDWQIVPEQEVEDVGFGLLWYRGEDPLAGIIDGHAVYFLNHGKFFKVAGTEGPIYRTPEEHAS